jgi:hypothetical protein
MTPAPSVFSFASHFSSFYFAHNQIKKLKKWRKLWVFKSRIRKLFQSPVFNFAAAEYASGANCIKPLVPSHWSRHNKLDRLNLGNVYTTSGFSRL